ncbi:lyase family protein [Nocardioides sp. AX2bis]|uniref:lyase family protein n=1 Tax=Nocardioides sp. AX2bis TaxID=2653157 RepID=UPI00135A0317|nr:lyase family protein [Nocardioides sp. AX2bis]
MTDLLVPGDHRADGVLDDAAVLAAMLRVEEVWLAALVVHDVAPATAALPAGRLTRLVGDGDLAALARDADTDGNPVIALVALLRARLEDAGEPGAARWLHRGMTSQDVVDTALVLGARDGVRRVRADLATQAARLAQVVAEHRDTPAAGRTLTQLAVPTTVGLRAAGWLAGLLDADDDLAALETDGWPVQVGGAGGTLAALVSLAGADRARAVVATVAEQLGLRAVPPWHTRRRPLTRVGDALTTTTDAWGHLAADVLALGRPEVGELAEGAGGGSSTMPGKVNPVRAVLLRRAALAGPAHLATLHLAAAGQVEERADGAWHAEWPALRALVRGAVTAGGHATDLLSGLVVHADVATARARQAAEVLTAEQRSMAALAGSAPGAATAVADPASYLGLAGDLVDAVLARATAHQAAHQAAHPTRTSPTPEVP